MLIPLKGQETMPRRVSSYRGWLAPFIYVEPPRISPPRIFTKTVQHVPLRKHITENRNPMPNMFLLPTLVLYLLVVVQPSHTKSQGFGARSRQGSGDFRQDYQLQSKLKNFVLSKKAPCDSGCRREGGSSIPEALRSISDDNDIDSKTMRMNATDHGYATRRHTLTKTRQRKWISRRKLKKQLHECEARLQETQDALNAPTFLFVQMAQHCTLEMVAGQYYLKTSDMDVDTYVFAEMPSQYATAWPTSYFVGYLFDELFPTTKPNAAFTFNVYQNQSEKAFEGPLISVLMSSHQINIQEDNSTLVVYGLTQSSEQRETSPVSNFFRGVDPTGNASVTFEHCSIFIDPAQDDNNVNSVDSYVAPLTSVDEILSMLEKSAQILEETSESVQISSSLDLYAERWGVKDAERADARILQDQSGLSKSDRASLIRSSAETLRGTGKLVKQCQDSSGCDRNQIISSVSDILLTAGPIVATVFPPAGIGLTIVGGIGSLFSTMTYAPAIANPTGAPPQQAPPPILPSVIQDAVQKALSSFTASLDTDVVDTFSDFLQMDLDVYVRRAGSLGYIRETKGAEGQGSIDRQVEMWYTQSFSGSWSGTYKPGLEKIESSYLTWFGSNENGLRSRVNKYIVEAQNICNIENKPYIIDKKNYLAECREMVDNAENDLKSMKTFAEAYLEMASRLFTFASQSVAIMQASSFCDPARFDNGVISEKCAWNAAIEDLLTPVFFTQGRALFLSKVMKEIAVECNPDTQGWPFSQACSATSCNYHYGLVVPTDTWISKMGRTNKEGTFVKFSEGTFAVANLVCKAKYQKWSPLGFGAGKVFAYPSGFQSDCDGIRFNEFEIDSPVDSAVYGAMPDFTLQGPFPRCAGLLRDDNLWAPSFGSDGPIYNYPPGLGCNFSKVPLSDVSLYDMGPEATENDCAKKCYDSSGLDLPFFFVISQKFNSTQQQCGCFPRW